MEAGVAEERPDDDGHADQRRAEKRATHVQSASPADEPERAECQRHEPERVARRRQQRLGAGVVRGQPRILLVALHGAQPIVIGQERPVRPPEDQPRLLRRMAHDPAQRTIGEDLVALCLHVLVRDVREVAEARRREHEPTSCLRVVADAEVVTGVRRQRRAADDDGVAHDPRCEDDQCAGRHQCEQPDRVQHPSPPAPHDERQGRQDDQPDRSDETSQAEHGPRRNEATGARRARHRPGDEQRQRTGQEGDEDGLGQSRCRVVDQVRLQRDEPRGDRANPRGDRPPADETNERQRDDASDEVHDRCSPRQRVSERRVAHEPPRAAEEAGVADRVVRRRMTVIGDVTLAGGDVLGVAHVERRIVGADVGAHGDDAPDDARRRADGDGEDQPRRWLPQAPPAPWARWFVECSDVVENSDLVEYCAALVRHVAGGARHCQRRSVRRRRGGRRCSRVLGAHRQLPIIGLCPPTSPRRAPDPGSVACQTAPP